MTLATGEEKTWQEKARSRTQRDTLYEPARVPEWAQNANSPDRRHTFRASRRSRNACQDFTGATLYRNLQEKCRGPKRRRRHCASRHSRKECQDFARATWYGNLQVKCRRQNCAQNAGEHCASLRSRNACQDFTKATFYGFFRPEWAPWSSTDLYTYSKNPSVWGRWRKSRCEDSKVNE